MTVFSAKFAWRSLLRPEVIKKQIFNWIWWQRNSTESIKNWVRKIDSATFRTTELLKREKKEEVHAKLKKTTKKTKPRPNNQKRKCAHGINKNMVIPHNHAAI